MNGRTIGLTGWALTGAVAPAGTTFDAGATVFAFSGVQPIAGAGFAATTGPTVWGHVPVSHFSLPHFLPEAQGSPAAGSSQSRKYALTGARYGSARSGRICSPHGRQQSHALIREQAEPTQAKRSFALASHGGHSTVGFTGSGLTFGLATATTGGGHGAATTTGGQGGGQASPERVPQSQFLTLARIPGRCAQAVGHIADVGWQLTVHGVEIAVAGPTAAGTAGTVGSEAAGAVATGFAGGSAAATAVRSGAGGITGRSPRTSLATTANRIARLALRIVVSPVAELVRVPLPIVRPTTGPARENRPSDCDEPPEAGRPARSAGIAQLDGAKTNRPAMNPSRAGMKPFPSDQPTNTPPLNPSKPSSEVEGGFVAVGVRSDPR